MIIPRIKIKRRISANTQNGTTEYVLEMFVSSIVSYNTVTQEEEGDYAALPLELFLYKKNNNRTDGDPVKESVASGIFMRVLEPADLDNENPVLFGYEKLRYSDPDDPRASVAASTLLPATNYSGAAISQVGVDTAIAPLNTHSKSGYYKTRVYAKRSETKADIATASSSIKSMIEIFKTKYLADAEYITDGVGVIETESYEI